MRPKKHETTWVYPGTPCPKAHATYWATMTAVTVNAMEKTICLMTVMPRTIARRAG
jgi:hypothetical protein